MIREEKEQKGLANLFVWFINIGQSFALISKVVIVECTLRVGRTRVESIEIKIIEMDRLNCLLNFIYFFLKMYATNKLLYL